MGIPSGIPSLCVLFLYPEIDKPLEDYSFACIVSRKLGEKLYDVTKPCLHVLRTANGKFEFADGVYFLAKEVYSFGGNIDWPVLCKALSKPVKAYSKPLMPKNGELPFQRVMIWHRYKHTNPPLAKDAEGHALLAFQAAQKWNGWMEKASKANKQSRQKWGFDDALKDVRPPEEWDALAKAGKQFAAGEAFQKFCEGIGLKRPNPTDFVTPYGQLIDTLGVTLQIHLGVREAWLKNKTR